MDASEAAQLMTIDKTFSDLSTQPFKEMKHPDTKKRNLRVVETYDIFPDEDVWSNQYAIVRYPERPSGVASVVSFVHPFDSLQLMVESIWGGPFPPLAACSPATYHGRR